MSEAKGKLVVLLLLKDGFRAFTRMIEKIVKLAVSGVAQALLMAWRNKGLALKPLLAAPGVLRRNLKLLCNVVVGSSLGRALVAAATSLLCISLHWQRSAVSTTFEASLSLLFGMFK